MYSIMLPGLGGREMRQYFNQIALGMIVPLAIGGAMLGYAWLGPLGMIFGAGAGIAVGVAVVEKGGFYRP
jgi:hypothetical protein